MTMKRGFTLIEVLVSLAIFSTIVAIAVGGFARALHAQKEASALLAVQSDAGATLEEIVREMRTGYLFCTTPTSTVVVGQQAPWTSATPPDCATACVASSTSPTSEPWVCNGFLHLYNANGVSVSYSLASGSVLRNGSQLTSNNVRVTYLSFMLFGQLLGDHWNPRITIAMGVAPSSTDPAIASDTTALQTTVSARAPDQSAASSY